MEKNISVWSALILCAFSVSISSITTAVVFRSSYNKQIESLNEQYTEVKSELEEAYNSKIDAIDEQLERYGEIAADIREIDELYRAMFPGTIDDGTIRDYAIKGYVAGTGDRYGFYYSPEEATALMDDVNGETDGIGLSVIYNYDMKAIEVISVTPDSPADKAGISNGDLIAYVLTDDGEKSVAELGYDYALSILRGEAGTIANFKLYRDPDGDGVYEEKNFEIERDHVDSVSVMYHIYEPDNSIGVIKITGFDKNTPEQFYTAVDSLKGSGAKKLIFDVRYNPGGDRDAVCEILDYLLPEGPILRTVDSDGNYTVENTSDKNFLDMPMAVVMNSDTASAGELFAAAIKDYDAGKLVGETTYGKGSMQSIVPVFDDGSLLRLTVALYCPPVSENYDGVGVTPDVTVALDEALEGKSIYKITDAEDNQLRAAAKTFDAAE